MAVLVVHSYNRCRYRYSNRTYRGDGQSRFTALSGIAAALEAHGALARTFLLYGIAYNLVEHPIAKFNTFINSPAAYAAYTISFPFCSVLDQCNAPERKRNIFSLRLRHGQTSTGIGSPLICRVAESIRSVFVVTFLCVHEVKAFRWTNFEARAEHFAVTRTGPCRKKHACRIK